MNLTQNLDFSTSSVDNNPLLNIADNYNNRSNNQGMQAYNGPSAENNRNGYSNQNNNAYNPLHTGFGGNNGYQNSPRYQQPPNRNSSAVRRQPRDTYANGYQNNGQRGTYRGTIGGNTKVTPLNFNYS